MYAKSTRYAIFFIAIYFSIPYLTPLWGQPNTFHADQVEFTHPDLDAQFAFYEVYAFDVAPLFESIQGLADYDFTLHLGENHQWSIILSLNDLGASEFELIELADGGQELLTPPLPFTYEGFNNAGSELPAEAVRMSIRQDAIVGYVFHNGQQHYLEPLSYLIEDAPGNYFLLYQPEAIMMETSEACGAALEQGMRPYPPGEAMELSKNEEACMEVEMLVLATQDMVEHLGSSFAVMIRIMDITNQMEGYCSFANLDFVISQFYISTSSSADPVSSTIHADTLITETQQWAADPANSVRRHDLGQLWVKRDIAGCGTNPPTNFDLWGCARIGSVCQTVRYNVCELATSNISCMARLSGHEIGHNFDGIHSDAPNANDLMHAAISCNTSQGFTTATQTRMNNYIAAPVGNCIKLCSELCDLALSGFTVSNVTCTGGQNGTLSISASTSYGPIMYTIAGPVMHSNQTGVFMNLPAGQYQILVQDTQFDFCQDESVAIIGTEEDEAPIVSCPENISVENTPGSCDAEVDIPQPNISDQCGISQTQYRYQPVDENGNALAPWTDWQNWSSVDLNPKVTLSVGNWKIEWRAIDNAGNTSSCSFCIEVIDAEAFILYCPASFSTALTAGFCITFVNIPPPSIIGNCEDHMIEGRIREVDNQGNPVPGPAGQWSNYAANLDGFFQLGIFEVEWKATDLGQNTDQCTFKMEVKDEELPEITSCPSGFSKVNDPGQCETYVEIPAPSASDNCGVSWLKARYRRVDGQGNPLPGGLGDWSQFADDISGYFDVGDYQIQWEARDPSGNSAQCSFSLSVIDQEAPIAHCRDNTVYLGANGQYNIQDFEVFDFFQSSDNCIGVQLAIQPPVVDCNDANSVVPVQVLAVDDAGNAQGCVSFLRVEKDDTLPPGWDHDAIGSTSGDAAYDPCTETFTLQSIGVSSPFDDLIQMAFTNQCGNFELVAKVDQISNGGYAGIMVRETNYSGARKVVLKTQLTPRIYRQFRYSTDGYTNTSFLQRHPSHAWLRIIRSGANFTGYSSYNGMHWQLAFSINLNMSNCVLVGLFTESLNGSTTATAQFSQVSFNSATPLHTSVEQPYDTYQENPVPPMALHLYPNPARDMLNVDLEQWDEQPLEISILNISGQLMWHKSLLHENQGPLEISIAALPPGIYFLKLNYEGQINSKRFSKN